MSYLLIDYKVLTYNIDLTKQYYLKEREILCDNNIIYYYQTFKSEDDICDLNELQFSDDPDGYHILLVNQTDKRENGLYSFVLYPLQQTDYTSYNHNPNLICEGFYLLERHQSLQLGINMSGFYIEYFSENENHNGRLGHLCTSIPSVIGTDELYFEAVSPLLFKKIDVLKRTIISLI